MENVIQNGRRTSTARANRLTPIDQNTSRKTELLVMLKKKAKRTAVSSRTISHRPRVHKNRETDAGESPRSRRNQAPSPAVNTNTGAQKCVIQRVMKISGVVCVRSSARKAIAPECT